MDELTVIFILLMAVPISFMILATATEFDPGITKDYTGYIVDVQYSAGAFGHADMTIVYFTNRTIILNSRTEINRNVTATLSWSESIFRDGKRFQDIHYIEG